MSSISPDRTPSDLDLTALLRQGDQVVIAQGACEPTGLVAALREQAERLEDVTVFTGFSLSGLFDVELAQHVRVRSYGAMASLAAVDAAGLLDVIPCHYSLLPGLIRDGSIAADVVMLQVTPPDENGLCSTGLSMDYSVEALAVARIVIAEVNDQLPRHPDAVTIAFADLTATVPVSRPLLTVPTGVPSEVDLAIAAGVAAHVPDGATLQLGFGTTVNAIGRLISERRDLRVHSALVGDWLLDLDAAGALAEAEHGRPVIVTGAAMGSHKLYDFVARDPRIELRRIDGIQAPQELASINGLVAINSALQVDLVGQVNVEMIGSRRVSALGGHADFMHGAQSSLGGRSIVALPSTASRRRLSRIVEHLDGGWVSTQQASVDVVVTEHGTATLRGRDLVARRDALFAIADPSHREALASTDHTLENAR